MATGDSYSGRTAWARNLATPVRDFLSTETGGASVVVAATIVALVWANSPWPHSYGSVWGTRLAVHLGADGISMSLRAWVDQGLMTLFFLVVGLEAKREFDLGELRERRRLTIPVLAALGGVIAPAAIYLAWNAGGPGARDWGAAISTDTALALSAVGLLTPRSATRMRVFLLSFAVVDDLVGLLVIAIVYTSHVSVVALLVAIALFGLLLASRRLPVAREPVAIALGLGFWLAMFESGIDPVVSGLAIGLATSAYSPSREGLARAFELTRTFREQPTPELARAARRGVVSSISPNERMQYALHPWTSYVIVPLFALANAGVHLSGSLLSAAVTSPITLGIVCGYIVGKPLGIVGGTWLATMPALRGPRSPVSSPLLIAAGTCAGVGFTVSLLISSLAFHGQRLAEAQLGVLCTLVLAPALTWLALAVVRHLPTAVRARQIAGTAIDILDLTVEVEPERDHARGSSDALVTIVEYGDFECPYCGQAERAIRELLAQGDADIRYVWRHLPLHDVHPHAQLAAEAAEAAAAQGRFWEMYDLLFEHQDQLTVEDVSRYAGRLGLDLERFDEALRRRKFAPRIEEDVASADESGVSGTPTFFINGRRHYGAYDIGALTQAVRSAKQRAKLLRAGSS